MMWIVRFEERASARTGWLVIAGASVALGSCLSPVAPPSESDSSSSITAITYYGDVQPILETHCGACHGESGLGGVNLMDFSTASVFAEVMVLEIDAGTMPPPAADPTCRDYVGSGKRIVSAAEREVLVGWIDEGLLEGEPDPGGGGEQPTAPEADLHIQLSSPYTPDYIDGNDYHCFILEHGRTEEFWVTELFPVVDAIPIVHHIALTTASTDSLAALGLPDGADGFACEGTDIFINQWTFLAAWAPGTDAMTFPDGSGIAVRPDERMVMQIHYARNVAAPTDLTDQTAYLLSTTDSVEREVELTVFTEFGFEIPANEPAYTLGFQFDWFRDSVDVFAIMPHMHVLGDSYEMAVVGDEYHCVARGSGFEFANQITYQLLEPVALKTHDTFEMECTWDNSSANRSQLFDPPQPIPAGAAYQNEMCAAFVYHVDATLDGR